MAEGRAKGRGWLVSGVVLGLLGVAGAVGIGLSLKHPPPAPSGEAVVPSAPPPPSTPPRDAGPPPEPPEPAWTAADDVVQDTLAAQREAMLDRLVRFHDFTPDQVAKVRKIFEAEAWLGQGNPKCTEHPMTRAECRERRKLAKTAPYDRTCKGRYMVRIYDPKAGQRASDAKVCIDQYEFPNIPCDYPVTWVRAAVAQDLCAIQGKRLCDAHEWEGACAGAVLPPEQEYAWGLRPWEENDAKRMAMEHDHNVKREIRWAYGTEKDHKKCATGSRKSDGCVTPTWERCGTNTYPAGAFPECVSPFGVYDQHGNAAEHMNYPMSADELASRGKLGQTEMKGSWFIFDMYEAHIDDCRWRAPDWHAGAVMSANSHMNYHLGFRCCRDLEASK